MTTWTEQALRFFDGETTTFSHPPYTYSHPRIHQRRLHIATKRGDSIMFLAWEIPNTGSYLHTGFMVHATHDMSHEALMNREVAIDPNDPSLVGFIDVRNLDFVLASLTFIPVLTLAPDHDTNLAYLNLILDDHLHSLVSNRKTPAIVSKNYRRAEKSLPAYVEWHGLERAYIIETMEERAERLGLTRRLASFIGRRIVA